MSFQLNNFNELIEVHSNNLSDIYISFIILIYIIKLSKARTISYKYRSFFVVVTLSKSILQVLGSINHYSFLGIISMKSIVITFFSLSY